MIIDKVEFEQEYLPESFEGQMSVFIDGEEWLIVNADPVDANQYTLEKKLTLRIKNATAGKLSKIIEHPADGNIRFGSSGPA